MANALAFFHRRLLSDPLSTPRIYPGSTAASPSPHSPVPTRWLAAPSARSSLPTLLPVFILFLLLLCFLSIFVLRDILHFTSLWLNRRRRLRAATGNPQENNETPPKTGLDPEILASFPTMPFEAASDLEEGGRGAECTVCLMEFAAGDAVRLVTICRHAFHQACIDSWLGAHTTCPVCRSDLQAPPDEAAVIAIREAAGGGHSRDGSEGSGSVSHSAIAIEEECGTEERDRKSHSSSCDRDGRGEEERGGIRINR